jgi:hypothetical protein
VRKSAYESDRTLIGSAVFRARITVDYETVRLRLHPGFADAAHAIRLMPPRARKAFWRNRRRFWSDPCYSEDGCL